MARTWGSISISDTSNYHIKRLVISQVAYCIFSMAYLWKDTCRISHRIWGGGPKIGLPPNHPYFRDLWIFMDFHGFSINKIIYFGVAKSRFSKQNRHPAVPVRPTQWLWGPTAARIPKDLFCCVWWLCNYVHNCFIYIIHLFKHKFIIANTHTYIYIYIITSYFISTNMLH